MYLRKVRLAISRNNEAAAMQVGGCLSDSVLNLYRNAIVSIQSLITLSDQSQNEYFACNDSSWELLNHHFDLYESTFVSRFDHRFHSIFPVMVTGSR